MPVKVTIRNLQKKIPISPTRVREAIFKALSLEGVHKPGEVTVCFVTDKAISEFNLLYLARLGPTDVIAFDNSDNKGRIMADILVSTDTAVRNAVTFKTSPRYELYLYILHGVLHILGYDDNTARGRMIMEDKARRALSVLHIRH